MMPRSIHSVGRVVRRFLIFLVLLALVAVGAAYWWLHAPLSLRASDTPGEALELEIEPGTTPRGVANAAVKAGIQTDARLL